MGGDKVETTELMLTIAPPLAPKCLAASWLATLPEGSRFFAWVHLYDPHDPYEAPPAWATLGDAPYDSLRHELRDYAYRRLTHGELTS